ncbi:hypothetical protein QUA62_01120 [Microcoleus sp. MON1_C1]
MTKLKQFAADAPYHSKDDRTLSVRYKMQEGASVISWTIANHLLGQANS